VKILHFLGLLRLPREPELDATGGVTRAALEIARAQCSMGHDVWVATAASDRWHSEWQGVRLRGLRAASWARGRIGGRPRDLRAWLPLLAFAGRHRPDVVQGHEYFRLRYVPARARIAHLHNSPFPETSPAQLRRAAAGYWRGARGTHAHVAVSRYVAHQLRLGVPTESGPQPSACRIYQVSNGVDHVRFAPGRWCAERVRLRREWGVEDSGFVFLFAGAVVTQKGVIELARAFAKLSLDFPQARLVVAGGSRLWGSALAGFDDAGRDYETQVREVLQREGGGPGTRFLGLVSPAEMPAVYAASDAVVVPSIVSEAFGLVAAEGLASGKPVIATRMGGLPELITGENGMLVPPEDALALLGAMRALIQDPALLARLSNGAASSVAHLTWERSARQLDAVYQELFAGGGGQ
jgi:glycosyltransferase involved in cell wall biosynthesis